MTHEIDPMDYFPAFTIKRKMLIDLDIGRHCVYFATVTAEYTNIWSQCPIALYNAKGRKLPNLLRRLISDDKVQYLASVN